MQVKVYKTRRITTQDSLFDLIDTYVPKLENRSVLAITSKIVSLCEGNIVPKDSVASKEALIRQTAEAYLDYDKAFPAQYSIQLTIKNDILIPSAGIDESNGDGIYILYPKDVQQSAIAIWEHIRKRDKLDEVGILITDSHTTPMRRGVTGLGLGWCGFAPVYSYVGKPDCFGVPLRVTKVNNLDALAASAVFCMGEGNEQTPFAVITEVPRIIFQSFYPTEEEKNDVRIPMEEDIYAPILRNARWVFNNKPKTIEQQDN